MNRKNKWGVVGAILFVVFGVVCLVTTKHSVFYPATSLIEYVAYPVVFAWFKMLSALGIHGEGQWLFLLPMIATIGLYLAALGYGIGLVLSILIKPKSE